MGYRLLLKYLFFRIERRYMLTDNYWKLFGATMGKFAGSSESITLIGYDGDICMGNATSLTEPYTLLGGISLSYSQYYGSYYGVFWGRGTTPPTKNDYKLEDPITDGTLATVGSRETLIKTDNGDHYRISALHQVTNNTNNDITITEAGIFGNWKSGGKVFLLDHTILETPVVIPARKTVPIEYAIKFPYGG
jgi:hypothetical protein